ncbi:MAG TPA: energy transducer TonB [Xanthomonadaceae bacterium]|nr:energy transducer TonB [Xanthomonadaceae bacterium]
MHIPRPTRLLFAALSTAGLLSACDVPPAPQPVQMTDVAAIDTPPPEYPMALACDGIGGTVTLEVTVGPDGSVTGATTRESSGQPALDAAALESVRAWRFRPATRNGQPVDVQIAVPMTFNAPPTEPEGCYFLRNGGTPPATL